jgi:hypothetical protein
MNDLYSTDHHALKEALDKKGWSPEMLSTFSGVHPGTVLILQRHFALPG